MKKNYFKYKFGKLLLPVFFPDATRGVIRALDTSDIEITNTRGILVNTFHLWQELGVGVLKEFGYLEYLNDGSEESIARIENLKEFRVVAKQYDSLGQFLENISLIESSNRALENNNNTVVLMTLHSAKGLEFDTVFMPGMEEGIFPHSKSMADPNELEEERRLCYVGITRARKNLYLTYTRKRTFYGGTGASILSRFIGEIPEELLEFKYS